MKRKILMKGIPFLTEDYSDVKSVTVPNVVNPPLATLLKRMANNNEPLPDVVGFGEDDDYSDLYDMDMTELFDYRRACLEEINGAKHSFHTATRVLAEKQQSSKANASPGAEGAEPPRKPTESDNTP